MGGLALVASGTASLETALFKTPMVIAYRQSPITWRLMRSMLYLPYVGMPNILAGERLDTEGTRDRREMGMGYIPQDRQRDGLVITAPLWENVMLGHQTQRPFSRGPWIDRGGALERTRKIIDEFDVRTPGPDVAALALSGGNQQKLIVGREMTAEPRVLIAAHPTRGIDVGAQADIWDDLRQARAAGLL